jgi:hypothetical protein
MPVRLPLTVPLLSIAVFWLVDSCAVVSTIKLHNGGHHLGAVAIVAAFVVFCVELGRGQPPTRR